MPRLYDGGSVTMYADFTNAISDAMHGKASEVLKALNNGEIPLRFYGNGQYADDGEKHYEDITAKVVNASGLNNLLDYVISFTIPGTGASSYESSDPRLAVKVMYNDASGKKHDLFSVYSIHPVQEAAKYKGQTGSFEVRIAV